MSLFEQQMYYRLLLLLLSLLFCHHVIIYSSYLLSHSFRLFSFQFPPSPCLNFLLFPTSSFIRLPYSTFFHLPPLLISLSSLPPYLLPPFFLLPDQPKTKVQPPHIGEIILVRNTLHTVERMYTVLYSSHRSGVFCTLSTAIHHEENTEEAKTVTSSLNKNIQGSARKLGGGEGVTTPAPTRFWTDI